MHNTELNFEDMKHGIDKAGGLFYQYRPCRRDVATIYDIENILICGGGAAPCGKDMKPLGEFLKEDLKVWMSYSNFLDMPYADTIVEIDGVNYLQKEQISSRLLNIIGAGVLSEN